MRKDNPFDVVRHLITTIGTRRATSVEEAETAAYVDGRLRRAGLKVSADPFLALANPGRFPLLFALSGGAVALLTGWLPFPSFLLSLWLLVVAASETLLTRRLWSAHHHNSQNIIGTCAAEEEPHWRVVLLAPLDAPADDTGLRQFAGRRPVAVAGRILAAALLTLFSFAMIINPLPVWWQAQAVPACYLGLSLVGLLPPRPHTVGKGDIGSAGALAVLLSAAEQLTTLRVVEVWVVALGATTTGRSGIQDVLARYPFLQANTLFLSLEQVGDGHLAYAPREGVLVRRPADTLLTELAAAVCAEEQALSGVEPRDYTASTSLAVPLHVRGYRALTLYTHGAPAPSSHTSKDGTDGLPDVSGYGQVLEQAVLLVVQMLHRLDSDKVTKGCDRFFVER